MKNKLKKIINYCLEQYHALKPLQYETQNLSSDKLFFLTGYDKSGTTWMKKTINEVESLACVGSNEYLDFFKGTAESRILDTIEKSDDRKSVFNISAKSFNNFFVSTFNNKIRQVAKKDALYYGEKSTTQNLELINSYFPDAKQIVLVRDLRDIIVSFAFHFERRYKGRLNNWTPERSKFTPDGKIKTEFIERETNKLLRYYNHIIDFKQNNSDKILIIKYEDLIGENGYDFFLEILSFINKSTVQSKSSQKAWDNNTFEKLSKGRKPGEKDESSFFRSGTSKDYVNHLTKEQIRVIEEKLAKPLSYFKYID